MQNKGDQWRWVGWWFAVTMVWPEVIVHAEQIRPNLEVSHSQFEGEIIDNHVFLRVAPDRKSTAVIQLFSGQRLLLDLAGPVHNLEWLRVTQGEFTGAFIHVRNLKLTPTEAGKQVLASIATRGAKDWATIARSIGAIRPEKATGALDWIYALNGGHDLKAPEPRLPSFIQVLKDQAKLECNLDLSKSDTAIGVKNWFESNSKLIDFLRKEKFACWTWYLPDSIKKSQVEWLTGKYEVEPTDNLSMIFYSFGVIPLWGRSGLLSQFQIQGGTEVDFQKDLQPGTELSINHVPVIRKCNLEITDNLIRIKKKIRSEREVSQICSLPNVSAPLLNHSMSRIPINIPEVILSPEPQTSNEASRSEALATARRYSEQSRTLASTPGQCDWNKAITEIQNARAISGNSPSYTLEEISLLLRAHRYGTAAVLANELVQKYAYMQYFFLVEEALAQKSQGDQAALPQGECGKSDDQNRIISASPAPEPVSSVNSIRITPEIRLSGINVHLNNSPQFHFVDPGESSLADSKRYVFNIPAYLDQPSAVIINDSIVNSSKDGLRTQFNIPMPIYGRQQCREVLVIDQKFESSWSDLCVELSGLDLRNLDFDEEAFYFRKKWGFWGQAGLSYVNENIPQVASSSAMMNNSLIAARMGVGAWYQNFQLTAYARTKVLDLTNSDYQPLWVQSWLGYGFELPHFWLVTPFLTPLVGFEAYTNSVPTLGVRYISHYFAPAIGFEARLVFGSRLETGGTFLFVDDGTVTETFMQADVRYWFGKDSIGLGYWQNSASATNQSLFSEGSSAFEIYYRRLFGW